MQLQVTDFNNADTVIQTRFANPWRELETILATMNLHLKQSDQAGIQGSLIFDPVGTNEFVKTRLRRHENWGGESPNTPPTRISWN